MTIREAYGWLSAGRPVQADGMSVKNSAGTMGAEDEAVGGDRNPGRSPSRRVIAASCGFGGMDVCRRDATWWPSAVRGELP